MINTIRLFRSKIDDLSAAFVLEFLKLVGFMVTDCEIKDYGMNVDIGGQDKYDINFILEMPASMYKPYLMNINNHKILTKSEDGISKDSHQQPKVIRDGMNYLVQIVNSIWTSDEEKNEMLFLLDAYERYNMFHYLYNKGNLKFIQEYYPIRGARNEEHLWREIIFNRFLNLFTEFYSYLLTKKPWKESKTVNYLFATLSMEYELNDVMTLMKKGRIYSTESMLKHVEVIRQKAPDMIRISYLAGNICSLDNLYLAKADTFYMASIAETKKINAAEDLLGFLYYQLGAYYERKYQNLIVAEEAYRLAYDSNNCMMRAFYKLARIDFEGGDYNSAIKKTNSIIRFLVNGYTLDQAMPGQQLYAYKSFVLMGDAYYARRDYDLSEKSYQRALKIANTVSKFYNEYDEDDHFFMRIQKMCMPTQLLLFKLINCASEYRNMDQVAQYYEELYEQT